MKRWALWGVIAVVAVAAGGLAAGGSGILFQALYKASGGTSRTAYSKLSDQVSVKDYGAVGDGTTDDTTALQAAITAAAAVGSSVIVPAGTYLTTLPLVIPSNSTLIGRGAKIKFSNIAANDSVITLTTVTKVTIAGLEIDGQKASVATVTEFKMGIQIKSSTEVTLRDIYSHDNKGDGLYIGADSLAAGTSGIYVENFRSDSNHRQGVSITNCSGCKFVGFRGTNTSGTAPQAGVDIEPNYDTDVISNIEFVAGEFTGNTGAGGQVVLRDAPSAVQRGIRFTNCAFNGNTGDGMLVYSGVQVGFTGSDFSSNTAIGLEIDKNSADVSVVNSTFRKNGLDGIALPIHVTYTTKRVKIINSSILDNSQTTPNTKDGISTSGIAGALTGLSVIGCDISNDAGVTQRFGIVTLSGTTNVQLIGNRATANTNANYSLADDVTTRVVSGNLGIFNVPI